MSGKWRAIQHRHRYTYSSVIFPPYFVHALNQTPSLPFFSEVKQLSSLNSIYSQVEHAKNIASSFSSLLSQPSADENTVFFASKFYVEIIFLENSLPLHKTLVSVLAKAKCFQDLIKNCFRELCEEYRIGTGKAKGRRFSISRAALTMMSTPKLGYLVEVVEECAVLVSWDVISGLNAVLSETREWSKPSPLVMEQCQEALSCMYYLLQRFPMRFVDMGEGQYGSGSDVLRMVLMTILSIFKSQAFSRDCFVSAGVSFCAALQVSLDADELGLFIMKGIFNQLSVVSSKIEFKNLTSKIPYQGNIFYEISSFTALSRLCLIRGILTAVSRTVLSAHFSVLSDVDPGSGDNTCVKRTVLYDGILPELCNYCENPTDSHFNFHALTVMQICLQQIKTLIQSNSRDFVECDSPFSEHIGSRILRIVWNNLEDPLSQTVKQVHLIFDLFLDIQASLCWIQGGEKNNLFLMEIAAQLLRLGPRCKGRYVPLASLTKRLGAKMILDMNPDLLFETTNAYIDDDVCCAATTFLKCFLECLRDEYWSSDGIQNGYVKYRCECLPPILRGLASGVTKLRSNMNTYALPVLLELDMDCIFPLLACIGVRLCEGDTELVYSDELHYAHVSLELEQQVAVLVSLLKVSRLLALIDGDIDWCDNFPNSLKDAMSNSGTGDFYSLICIKGIKVKIPVTWLVLALIHIDDSLRIDAAEFLFLNPKTSSLPSSLELSLMREAVPLNMRCCSTAFQMKWTSLFRKFFSRVKTALERQYKQGTFRPIAAKATKEIIGRSETEGTVVNLAEYLFNLMKWLNCFLFFSCYPAAPYERKIMAMELMLIMLNVWSTLPPSVGNSDAISTETCLFPYTKGFMLCDSTLLLVGSIIDSWDRLRVSSFNILLHFPTPLPGIDTPDKAQEAIMWAKKLVCSPRVRESDAGALTLRLIFRKYVLEVGWKVNLSLNVVSCHLPANLPNGESHVYACHSPVVEYISSLIDWLLVSVENGEKDLSEACRNSFVHGVLLTLRYTFEELNWNCKTIMSNIAEMKLALVKLLSLVMRITSLALWVVSADAWYLPENMEDMDDDDEALPLEGPGKEVLPPPEVGNEETPKITRDVRSSDQIVMVGCWLAMKEVSLLLGTIIRKIPLPTSDVSQSGTLDVNGNNICMTSSEGMLDLKQLEIIGNHFLDVLLKMKHNGAIDKTRAGFTALCNRLLCSDDARLCKLTESWMEQLMDRMVAKGQTVDDLLRRSAGIPAAFIAFFLSEPEGSPKRLLPKALRWLIDVANMSLIEQNKGNNWNNGSASAHLTNSSQVTGLSVITEETEKMSKIRDEGVIPTVHAFNVLRAAFNDTNLATDTSGFAAEALILSIRSFSSSYWEVRNSACLAYTALVRRMIGFLNVQKRESSRRALTGLEFFHRYPSLHSFLFHELKVATELLWDESSGDLGSNLAKVVHPSLCPMLILLSRLKPSAITSETGDALDPYSFLPFIRRCSVQSNFRIRVLASRAIAGLISNEKLPIVLLNIASQLPCAKDKIMNSDSCIALNTKYGKSSTFNSIHGILLQLSSLLDTNCRNLADFSKKDKILTDLIQILMKCSWIGRPQQCPCPILNSCFLHVLDNMLSVARTCVRCSSTDAIWNLVWSLSSECLDLETLQRTSYYDPTRAELRKQAAISYFNSIFQTSEEFAEENPLTLRTCPQSSSNLLEATNLGFAFSSFRERLICCISDPSYEVRLATLKWVLLFLHVSGSKNYDIIRSRCLNNFDLQTTLIECLAAEKHHKCINYILKVLYSWNLLECQESNELHVKHRSVADMDCDSLCQFWDMLVSLYKVTRHLKTRQTLICCMGICIKRFSVLLLRLVCLDIGKKRTVVSSESDYDRRLSYLYSCISYFVHLIELHSDPSEPVNMRGAAAESVVASGLLEQAKLIGASVSNRRIPDETPCSDDLKIDGVVNQYGHKILDLWLTCVKLLEDEDVGIRSKLAFDVQKCLTRGECGDELQARMVPSQVERVIQLSIQHLSSAFGHWIDFFDYLCHWILNATEGATSIISKGDIVRRVFDKEIDNHHEEKLLICQLFCSNLEKIPISKYWIAESIGRQNVMGFLYKWRRRFCQRLVSFADDYVGQQGGVDWIGGVSNHKDAFLPLYANLLAFFTLSNCIFREEVENTSKSMLTEVSEVGKNIHPFLRNPLISNLYFLVVDVHEEMLGENTSHLTRNLEQIDSGWDFYEPYFLLG